MELQTLLERVEPSRLKQLGSLFCLGDELSKAELVDWVSQELPFCQVEEDGACVGIDGAFYIAVDWVNDMMTLELLRESTWLREESSGRVRRFVIADEASELSLTDARMLLGLLAVATYNQGELPIPAELNAARYAKAVRIEEVKRTAGSPSTRPSQRAAAEADDALDTQRPSIPPGFSETFDSMRPTRQSVRPASAAVGGEDNDESGVIAVEPAGIEYVLTLPRHSLISCVFALAERGAQNHAVCFDKSSRAILTRDAVEAAKRLYDDHRDSMPPPANHEALVSYRKRLTSSLTFFGIPKPDASALVSIAMELGQFPEFYSDECPPPVKLVRAELKEAPEELSEAILQLMYDCLYREQLSSAAALSNEINALT